MKILSVVGARPQFIKLAPLSSAVRKAGLHEIIVHTGQHYDKNMSELFFDQMEIPEPDFNLNIGSGKQGEQTAKMLIELEDVFERTAPDVVVVFGDTNSTLAAAIASVKVHIKTVHVEAGLRSFNREMPEEINRILTDHACDMLFAPTKSAMNHLKNEGLEEKSYLTGDIMVDSVKKFTDVAERKSRIIENMKLSDKSYYLLTLHRPYNVDNPEKLRHLINELSQLDDQVIFPVHPRTRKQLEKISLTKSNINLIEPVGYLDFLKLQKHSKKIITDSGGIQKEAFILQKPCITLRTETEWVETVDSRWNMLISPHTENFSSEIINFSTPVYQKPIFGEHVSNKILSLIA